MALLEKLCYWHLDLRFPKTPVIPSVPYFCLAAVDQDGSPPLYLSSAIIDSPSETISQIEHSLLSVSLTMVFYHSIRKLR